MSSVKRRISNGPMGSKNNNVDKIIFNTNGVVDFESTRNKIMYSQNKYESYSISEYKNQITINKKSKGKI